MTDAETAWVAGLLEGEGCFMTEQTHGKMRGRVAIQMTDEDVLLRLATVVGTGSVVSADRASRPDRKPIWQWRIQSRADVLSLTDQIYPHLGKRRRARIEQIRRDLAR
jgi:hypothetical protein